MRVLSRLLVALLILTSFPAPLIAEEVVETEDKDTAISSGAEVGEELNDTTDPLEEFNEIRNK